MNLFSLLCDGLGNYSSNPPSDILQFGGPILYFVLQTIIAYSLLVWLDSGKPIPAFLRRGGKHKHDSPATQNNQDVVDEKERVARGPSDELQVIGLRKKYHGAPNVAVDDVSFGVSLGDTFALIGPNGAGKTTTLACIRGMERPNAGDIVVGGHSITKARNQARAFLGVCPQVNAIDPNLTVGQHLWVYGKLKGVPSKPLKQDIDNLLAASGLSHKKDQLSLSLSGGNQRKMALAIALIGDREVVLIDEFSSGVDPFSKREAWQTVRPSYSRMYSANKQLAALTRDRAVVMTTHSMEEVDALATRVGIIASKMLAVGTPASLKSRFATYEIHLPASQVSSVLDYFHSHAFPSAHASMDTLTRISVSGVKEDDLPQLLDVLQGAKRDLGVDQVTIQEASTETAFLEIVKQHNIQEEERHEGSKKSWWKRL
jgi:ATP-binding cassette subfamily A (ABC1) protein 3